MRDDATLFASQIFPVVSLTRLWRCGAWVGFAVVAGACASAPESFFHRAHRQTFALQPDELQRARYFVSERIVAHALGASGEVTGPSEVLVLEIDTPGTLTDAGSDWLRVSFDRGPGVLFVARPEATPDSWYEIASDPEPGRAPRRIRDIEDSIATLGNRRYRLIYGAHAHLLIDADALNEMLESRPRARGRDPN